MHRSPAGFAGTHKTPRTGPFQSGLVAGWAIKSPADGQGRVSERRLTRLLYRPYYN